MIVDDDADQRALLGELLEGAGCAVTEAGSGHEAMQILLAGCSRTFEGARHA